jgi:hypothetical protein
MLASRGDLPPGDHRALADTAEVDSALVAPFASWRLTLERILDIDPDDMAESYVQSYSDFLADVSGIEDSTSFDAISYSSRRRRKVAEVLYAYGQSIEGGGEDQGFTGSNGRWFGRVCVSLSDQVTFSVSMEKDAGERTDLGFLSGFVRCAGLPGGLELIVGDYVIDAGLGLVSSGDPNGGGRVAVARKLSQTRRTARPYQYRNEFSFLRGLSWTMSLAPSLPMRLYGFISQRSLAGSRVDSGLSLSTSTLFRTNGEISRRGAIREILVGGRVEYSPTAQSVLGLTLSRTGFKPTLMTARQDQSADGVSLVGVDAGIVLGKFALSAEAARSGDGGTAFAAVGSLKLDRTTLLIDGRSYARDYRNHRFGGPGSGRGANETGFGIDCHLQFAEWYTVRGALGAEWTYWQTGDIPATDGNSWLVLGGNFRLLRSFDLSLEFRRKQTEEELSAAESGYGTLKRSDVIRDRLGFSGRLALGRKTELIVRADLVWRSARANRQADRGDVVRLELSHQPVGWCSLNGSVLLFSSSSRLAQPYVLEDDPISTQRWCGFSGDGTRWGIVAKVRLPDQGLTGSLYWGFEESRRRQPFVPVEFDRSFGFRLHWELRSEAD